MISKEGDHLKPHILLDASIYIFRYYFALPEQWHSHAGWPTQAVYGFTHFLLDILITDQPDYLAVAFDESLESCFRNDIYPGYKSSRGLPDEALALQLQACQEIVRLLGICSFASDRYEADDLLGSLVDRLQSVSAPLAIVTRDKDLGQLLKREQDYLWDKAADERFFATDIYTKFGVLPAQIPDYLALVGDTIDDIPGVPGVGPKTAKILLQHYSSIDEIINHVDQVADLPVRGAKTLASKLIPYAEQLVMARTLAKIIGDLPVIGSDAQIALEPICPDRLGEFCQRMGFAVPSNKIAKLRQLQSGADQRETRRL